jgi:iron complex transport system permease protein
MDHHPISGESPLPMNVFFSGRNRVVITIVLILVLLGAGFIISLSFGSVRIPMNDVMNILTGHESSKVVFGKIIWNIRLPKAITAVLAGAALSMAGLQMQTIFRNPLADPFVLGVNSGSSLGVAIVVLALGPGSAAMLSGFGMAGNYAIVVAATMGAGIVLTLIMILSARVDLMTLLIMGLMIGYATAAIVNILMFFAMPERLQSFFSWTYGNFGTVTWDQMNAFVPAIILGLLMCLVSAKVMNAFLLGESYARSMGVNINFWRTWILISASLLTGAVTGFCGPIGFIGVAVPHLSRSLLQTSDHRILFPGVLLLGGFLALAADFVAQVPGSRFVLPLNSITALMGAPVIVWLLLSKRNLRQAFGSAD